jgi:hypothetical protein
MIGEQLYLRIARAQPARAGKITGMLLEGLYEGELLRLIESPADLDTQVSKALAVLERVKGGPRKPRR